ncbi:hypothetical protein [Microbacterium kunmingense]|uniref:hypothetical protein n=1 Tax=Microbacterium kunmingense TaxID=2915939 RepID=UPI0020055438|nr:hypothetical protein [Microbacterium kunmingense]
MITADIASSAAEKLAEIKSEINDLVRRREQLLASALAELIAHQVPARVISMKGWTGNASAGDRVYVLDAYDNVGPRLRTHTNLFSVDSAYRRNWGPEAYNLGVLVHRGLHEVLLVDGTDILAVAIEEVSDADHRRAVQRLRTAARYDGIRVHVRDREVTLDDGMGNTLHTGDVESAFHWLFNIDPNER